MFSRKVTFVAIGFFVLALAAYWMSLSNKFVAWDDTYLIYFNPALKRITPATLKIIFTTYDPELYIPLTFFSYQLDYLIAGLQPFFYHLHSLVLHTLSALLVVWIVARLARNEVAGIVAGLLFLIHPLNVEAVSWASGRKDVLSTVLMLASLAFYLRKNHLGSLAAFALSLMAKVMTATLPVVLLLIDFLQGRKMDRKAWLEKIPYFALSVVFGVIGMFGKKDVTAASTLLEKILMAGKSTVFYLEKLVAPSDLAVIYPYNGPITLGSPAFFVPLLIVAVLIAATLWSLRKTRVIAFGVAFFLITLTPTFLNFKKAGDVYLASDRYVYVPAIGLFFLVGLAVAWTWDKGRARGVIAGAGAIVVLVLSLLTYKQSLTWANSETLFLKVLRDYPDAIAARINLGRVYRESDRLDEAREQLNAALAIRPHPRVYSNLAALESKAGNLEKALELYRKGNEADPKDPEPVFGIGIVYAEQKKYAEAEAMYLKAIELKANFTGIHNNLGALYLEQGKNNLAEEQFRKALEIDPYYPDAHYNLANLLAERGDIEGAIDHLEETLAIDPGGVDAAVKLAPLYVQAGRLDEAIRLARRTLEEKLGDATAEKMAFDTVKAVLAANPNHAGAKALLDHMMEIGVLKKKS